MKTFTKLTTVLLLLFSIGNIEAQTCQSYNYSTSIGGNFSGSLPSDKCFINSDLDITGSADFTDAEILIQQGVKIIVHDGAELTIAGSHLYSCTDMWQGIIVETGGKLIVDKGTIHDNSLIEDAVTAIELQYFYYDQSNLTGNALSIDNTIFNRNKTGIDFGQSRNASGNAALYPRYYPISLKNSVFTCRDIPFSAGSNDWVRFSDFKITAIVNATNYPATPETNSSPYIDEATYPSDNSDASLKSPYGGLKSEIGINFSSFYHYNGIYKIGDEGSSQSPNTTIFDNQTIGAKVYATNVEFLNCTFQNTPNSNPNPETYGILAEQYDETDFHLSVKTNSGKQRNAFFDCKHAITANFYTHVNIENAHIRSNKTAPPGSVQEGYEGISIKTNSFGWNFYNNAIYINYNEIINIGYPITLKYEDRPWIVGSGSTSNNVVELANIIEINSNRIDLRTISAPPATIPAEYFIDQAVNLEVVAPTAINTTTTFPPLRVNNNYVGGAHHGITISNWVGKDVRVLNNYCVFYNFPNVINPNSSGITFNGCIPQSAGNFVYYNGVAGYDGNTNFNYSTNMLSGVLVNNGNGFTVRCNYTNGALNSMFQFRGSLPNTLFFNNRMTGDLIHGGNRGLVLNRSIIGVQGNTNTACDNYYYSNGYWINNSYKTFCSNADATQSPMYVHIGNPAWDPAVNGYSSGGGQFTSYGAAGTLYSGTANGYGCPYIYNKHVRDEEGRIIIETEVEAIDINEDEIPIGDDEIQNQKLEETIQLAQGLTLQSECEEPELRLYVAQMQLYQFLLSPNGWVNKSSSLADFVEQNNSSSFGIINEISKNILSGDTASALQQLGSWDKVNRVDENYAKFLLWTIQRKQNQTLNLDEIVELATRCPQTDGNVVFAAQNLYNSITNEHRLFTTSCDDMGNEEQGRGVNQSITNLKPTQPIQESLSDNKVTVFPNPAKSVVNIKANNLKKIELLNAVGAVVRSQNANGNSTSISIDNLSSGVYIIRVTDTNNEIIIRKIFKNLY